MAGKLGSSCANRSGADGQIRSYTQLIRCLIDATGQDYQAAGCHYSERLVAVVRDVEQEDQANKRTRLMQRV